MSHALVRCFAAALVVLLCAGVSHAAMPTPGGAIPGELRDAFTAGLLDLPAAPDPLGTSAARAVWRIPVLLVGYSDDSLTFSAADFNTALFDSTGAVPTGSLLDYYRWVSEGRLTVVGEVVATVQLPNTREYYAFNSWGLNSIATPNNTYGLVRDALNATRSTGVDWSSFDLDGDGFVDMLWVVHAGVGGESQPWDRNNIWSITSRMSVNWRLGDAWISDDLIPGSQTQYVRIDRFSSLPERSGLVPGRRSEIGVYAHEFGHALGLPDLYDTSQLGGAANAGPGNWSLMATGGWGPNGVSPETPSHLGAWPMLFLGWRQTIRPAADRPFSLPPLVHGGDIVELWYQGESHPEHFLIENRQALGFDRYLPSAGLVVYQVDEAAIGARLSSNRVNAGLTPGLRLVEADGDSDLVVGFNRGDANDPFPGALGKTILDDDTTPDTRTFLGAVTNLALRNIAHAGSAMQFDAQVVAPGWLPAEDAAATDYAPLPSGSPPVALRALNRDLHLVQIESRSGIPRAVLRTSQGGAWGPAFEISTGGPALEVAATLVAGRDLVVVWSDVRAGVSRLYYRARIGNAWTVEQPLTGLSADARNPSLAAAEDGTIHLAWLEVSAGLTRTRFMRFAYTSPWGQAIAVTDTTNPGPPQVVGRPDGGAWVLWADRDAPVPWIHFASYHPDSGLGQVQPLTPLGLGAQASIRGAAGADGTLHAIWIENSVGMNRIRYQRRTPLGVPDPYDATVVAHGSLIENPSLAIDAEGALHLAFERSERGALQSRYLLRRESHGWDFVATNLTQPEDGDAIAPLVVPDGPGHVTVVWTGHAGPAPRLVTRRRAHGTAPPVVSVARGAAASTPLRLGPNPLRAGTRLALFAPGVPSGTIEVFDLAGRRVARTDLQAVGVDGVASIDRATTARWSAGIYFVRLHGRAGSSRIAVVE